MTNLGTVPSMILGFCAEVDENWALTGYYTATTSVLGQPVGPIFKSQESKEGGLYNLFCKEGSIMKCRKCLYSLCDA